MFFTFVKQTETEFQGWADSLVSGRGGLGIGKKAGR